MPFRGRPTLGPATLFALSTCILPIGCDGGVVVSGQRESTVQGDGWVGAGKAGSVDGGTTDGLAGRDSFVADARTQALPTKPGEPCPLGKCAGKLLCIAAICHAPCDQPNPRCNDRVSTCKANQTCRPASSFSDACFPANNKIGGTCGQGIALCPGGSLCVRVGTQGARCLQLCKYGCSGRCVKTTTGCNVCL